MGRIRSNKFCYLNKSSILPVDLYNSVLYGLNSINYMNNNVKLTMEINK